MTRFPPFQTGYLWVSSRPRERAKTPLARRFPHRPDRAQPARLRRPMGSRGGVCAAEGRSALQRPTVGPAAKRVYLGILSDLPDLWVSWRSSAASLADRGWCGGLERGYVDVRTCQRHGIADGVSDPRGLWRGEFRYGQP